MARRSSRSTISTSITTIVTTVFGTSLLANNTQGGFTAEESLDAPPSTKFNLQYVHAAQMESQTVPKFTVYLTAAGAGIGGAEGSAVPYGAPIGGVLSVPEGIYEIVVTDAGNHIVFDSGLKGIALLPTDANVLQLAMLDGDSEQQSADGSPIFLLLLDNNGNNLPLHNGAN